MFDGGAHGGGDAAGELVDGARAGGPGRESVRVVIGAPSCSGSGRLRPGGSGGLLCRLLLILFWDLGSTRIEYVVTGSELHLQSQQQYMMVPAKLSMSMVLGNRLPGSAGCRKSSSADREVLEVGVDVCAVG